MHSDLGLDALLAGAATADAGAPALAAGELRLSYGELDAAVSRVKDRLEAVAGELEGARVAVIAPNVGALVIGMFAAWRAGAVAVPLSARLREYELAGMLKDAQAAAVVTVAVDRNYSFSDLLGLLTERLPAVRGYVFVDADGEVVDETRSDPVERPPPLDPEVAAILYTSGTTGAPKGALIEHASELHWARTLAEYLQLTPDDRTALVIPASHAFGLACLMAAIASRSLTVLVDGSLSPEPLLRAIAEHEATVVHGSPAVFSGLLEGPAESLATVRTGFVGGAASAPELLERLDRAGVRVLNVFGMTEVGAAACCRSDDPDQARHTSVGRPLAGYEFRAVAHTAGTELQVRGPYVTKGYFRHDELTAEAFDGDWFRTGDLGTIDADGRVRIVGRAKDVVDVAGFSVFPAEVENFLLTHPDIAQAAVIGVPHRRMGQVLKAFVVARPGSDLQAAAILRFARPRIAGYKIPYAIEIVSAIPRLASGKPDRNALRERA